VFETLREVAKLVLAELKEERVALEFHANRRCRNGPALGSLRVGNETATVACH